MCFKFLGTKTPKMHVKHPIWVIESTFLETCPLRVYERIKNQNAKKNGKYRI